MKVSSEKHILSSTFSQDAKDFSALLQMSANMRWQQWLCILCDSISKVCLKHQKHFRACRPGVPGLCLDSALVRLVGLTHLALCAHTDMAHMGPDSPFSTLNSLHLVTKCAIKCWKEEEKVCVCLMEQVSWIYIGCIFPNVPDGFHLMNTHSLVMFFSAVELKEACLVRRVACGPSSEELRREE